MRYRLKKLVIMSILWISVLVFSNMQNVSAQPYLEIQGRVEDAHTGLPIFNATILILDLDTLDNPVLGAGIYATDENGEYVIPSSYLKLEHTYYLYVYMGDLESKAVDYVPVVIRDVRFETSEIKTISFQLIPGALLEWEGVSYLVQSSSPEDLGVRVKITAEQSFEEPLITIYGDRNFDVYNLGLSPNIAIIPANEPVVIEASIWYITRKGSRIVASQEVFHLYNNSQPFILSQGEIANFSMSSFSLKSGLEFVESKFVDISAQLDKAQDIGFVVFDDRRSLQIVRQNMVDGGSILASAEDDSDYYQVWQKLREALTGMDLITMSLDNKQLISKTSAVYLSAIMAIFSSVLAFFLFEQNRRKLISFISIYAVFLICLYFFYPGAHIIIDENITLFLQSAGGSFALVAAVVFGIPRIWKERRIEGRVSWRSAISIIFSMGKRQIRRRRIRGFFTILSIIILVLAFTSLTSFGTAFGIVVDDLGQGAPSDGIMVKRMLNVSSIEFSPLGFDDPLAIARSTNIENVTVRLKNLPTVDPIIRLVNPEISRSWVIYGILGVTPSNEAMYTGLDEVVQGDYLSDTKIGEILLSSNVANHLGMELGDNVTLEVLGTIIAKSYVIVGIIDGSAYEGLADMDGGSYGPLRYLKDGSVRRCNNTEIVILSEGTVKKLQDSVDARYGEGSKQVVVLSDFVFQPGADSSIDSITNSLIFVFNYDVFVSENQAISYYHIGSFIELKGAAELVIPLIMVGLNVSMVMMNAVYERRKEIRTLSMVGLNPTHIGLTFVAEAIILGMVGGSLGYLLGLGFFRVMTLFGQDLLVREKLEWWWSAIGFGLALAASVLSSIRPAALAVTTYTPSKVKRIKRTEKETETRKDEIFKVYQERQLSMPVKVLGNEKEFFVGFFLDRLFELKSGYLERVENIEDLPEIENVKGELVKAIKFEYVLGTLGQEKRTRNSLIMTKSLDEDYFRVKLSAEPTVSGESESTIERTIAFVHDTVLYWVKNKGRMIQGI